MPDENFLPPVQNIDLPKGDEVILPFTGDPLDPISGFTFTATYTPWGQSAVMLHCEVDEAANKIGVIVTNVQSGSVVVRRYSDQAHQRTVAIVRIRAVDPAQAPSR